MPTINLDVPKALHTALVTAAEGRGVPTAEAAMHLLYFALMHPELTAERLARGEREAAWAKAALAGSIPPRISERNRP